MGKTLYILCGLPFSGKTTLAKAVVKAKKDTTHVCVDEFFDAKEKKDKEAAWHKAFIKAYSLTKNYLKSGKSVVFDATNFLKKERDKLRKIADKFGAESCVIFIDTPEKKARLRLEKNRQKKGRKDISESDWEEVTSQFEYPEEDEDVILYQPEDKLEEWLDKT